MFDKLILAACTVASMTLAACTDSQMNSLQGKSEENRTPPAATAFYTAPVVVETPVTPVAEVEDVPVYTPPTVYVEPIRDPNICIEEWRKPCPHD